MMRGVWGHNAVGWVIAASLLPVITGMVLVQGIDAVLRLGLCGGVILAWQVVFRHRLGVPMTPTGAVTAVALALLAPAEAPLWQIVLAVSFGVVIGELIFGGWGRGFLSAGIVSLAFLSLSLPAASFDAVGLFLAIAVAPAALILLMFGIVALPVLLASCAGFALVMWGAAPEIDLLATSGGLAFALLYLVADPVASAVTPLGRWIYGGLAGALTGLLLASAASATQSVVFATLLASIFAPLIDQGIIMAQTRLRKI